MCAVGFERNGNGSGRIHTKKGCLLTLLQREPLLLVHAYDCANGRDAHPLRRRHRRASGERQAQVVK
jgi:hypothetical protein